MIILTKNSGTICRKIRIFAGKITQKESDNDTKMKIGTLIFNFILLGLACLSILSGGQSEAPPHIMFKVLLLLVPVLNIVFISGSTISMQWLSFNKKNPDPVWQSVSNQSASYLLMKIAAIILNIALIAVTCLVISDDDSRPKGYLVKYIVLLVLFTPVLSLFMTIIS
jgi:hypothetical protein